MRQMYDLTNILLLLSIAIFNHFINSKTIFLKISLLLISHNIILTNLVITSQKTAKAN